MSEQHPKEFAWSLADSKHPFLWIVRPDVTMGESASLPEEFFEEIEDRGLMTSWCPQEQTNFRYACTTWGIGMEINHDVTGDDVKALVKEMMEGDNGEQMKQKGHGMEEEGRSC
ncbi:hypothetical protein CRYUN_Cryun17cG0095400 [Craigia yunnanensis]